MHAACGLLRRGDEPAPVIVEFGLYRAPGGTALDSDGLWSVDLSPAELDAKRELVRCFATQARVIGISRSRPSGSAGRDPLRRDPQRRAG